MGSTLREQDPKRHFTPYLDASEIKELGKHNNKSLGILKLNNADIAQLRTDGQLDAFSHIQVNNTMVNFINWMGITKQILL